jgi:hypothetical protein
VSIIGNHSIFHIYSEKKEHKCISPTPDISKERRSGPTLREQKARRKEKKDRKSGRLPAVDSNDTDFFLHKPFLAFHVPPRVLYMGNSKHDAEPAVLIHRSCLWREYKLQLGPSIAKPGVIDPRGVVAWKHNGGDKSALKADDRKFKGYRVKTWRLWGETGKEYVHSVKRVRQAGEGLDPDVLEEKGFKPLWPEKANEVVYLRWTNPLSLQTRRYHFQYAGLDFYWKGTGTVKESRACGMFLRYNHLKLVVTLPVVEGGEEKFRPETCLGKFISSVAKAKSGTLELYDSAILRLVEEHAPSILTRGVVEGQIDGRRGVAKADEGLKISKLKRSTLYQLIVATAMCMITSEKQKRHTLIDCILAAGDGGGGGGGC